MEEASRKNFSLQQFFLLVYYVYFVSGLGLKAEIKSGVNSNVECVRSSWRSRLDGGKELFDI